MEKEERDAGYDNKLFDLSMNKKFENFDKSNIPIDEGSYKRSVVEKRKGTNYLIKYEDYPVDLDRQTWNNRGEKRKKAEKKLNKWKKKNKIRW